MVFPDEFAARHIGPSGAEVDRDARRRSASASLEELVDRAVPEAIRDRTPLALPDGRTEAETLAWLDGLAARNQVLTSLIGQGYADTITPPVILRNLLENPAWYTAYTPYQPEISQGRLEALLNFQTMVSDLTAMDLANASLLDEPTAAAEAMAMLARVNAKAGTTFFVDAECHPQTIDVVRTRAEPIGIDVVVGDLADDLESGDLPAEGVFGVLLQYPGTTGVVRDFGALVDNLHAQGTLVAVAADLLALVLLAPPGEWGADVVVGSAQRFGVPMGYGGPHAGFFATRDEYRRNVPGSPRRVCRSTAPAVPRCASRSRPASSTSGARRPRATSAPRRCSSPTSPGCTRVYHGPDGLRAIAERVHAHAALLFRELGRAGFEFTGYPFFDTLAVRVDDADAVLARALDARHQPAPARRRHRRRRVRRDEHASTPSPRCSPRSPATTGSTRARGTSTCSAPKACAAPRRSSPTRCSAPTTPRRRCCATCGASPTATSRSTAR